MVVCDMLVCGMIINQKEVKAGIAPLTFTSLGMFVPLFTPW